MLDVLRPAISRDQLSLVVEELALKPVELAVLRALCDRALRGFDDEFPATFKLLGLCFLARLLSFRVLFGARH
jgi:hypothetical protein